MPLVCQIQQSKTLVSKNQNAIVKKRRMMFQKSASKVLTDARKDLKMLCSGESWKTIMNSGINDFQHSRINEQWRESSFDSENFSSGSQKSSQEEPDRHQIRHIKTSRFSQNTGASKKQQPQQASQTTLQQNNLQKMEPRQNSKISAMGTGNLSH